MVLASNCAGFAPERITRPYGEADGFLPIKNSGSKNTLSRPFCFTTFQFSQVLFFWGEKFCHKIRQNGSPSTCMVPKILTNLQVLEANGKGFLSARFPFQKWHCLLQPKAIDYLSKRNHTLCDINLKKVDISIYHFWIWVLSQVTETKSFPRQTDNSYISGCDNTRCWGGGGVGSKPDHWGLGVLIFHQIPLLLVQTSEITINTCRCLY